MLWCWVFAGGALDVSADASKVEMVRVFHVNVVYTYPTDRQRAVWYSCAHTPRFFSLLFSVFYLCRSASATFKIHVGLPMAAPSPLLPGVVDDRCDCTRRLI